MSEKTTQAMLAMAEKTGSPGYGPAPMVLERGEGMYLFDTEGRRYLDFLAGIAVNCLGQCHPKVVEAVQRQAGRLLQVSNMFWSDAQIRLQGSLLSRCFGERVFLCNSGAEANEAAIKLARRYQRVVKGDKARTEIITFKDSFHGRTLAAVTATGQPKYHEGFEPLPPGFVYAAYNDLASVEALIGPQTVAVMVEPIQGEGGVKPSAPGFLGGLKALCAKHGALLVMDEVQTGVGRTGSLFAYQGYGVEPDIMTLAKGLGGGLPIGAMVAKEEVFRGFVKGSHASTFGGNPVACAAACAVLEEVDQPAFLEQVREVGEFLQASLRALDGAVPIQEVRGVGLMVGAEVGAEVALKVVAAARARGLILNTAGSGTLRFVPPLIATRAHVEEAMGLLRLAMEDVAKG
jgi:predicted acetylornithine/succinylornithine family transaminase